jgi:hypothetical protein
MNAEIPKQKKGTRMHGNLNRWVTVLQRFDSTAFDNVMYLKDIIKSGNVEIDGVSTENLPSKLRTQWME